MPRVLVIGARRTRQGIGPFVARAFARAGATVRAVVGSTDETARQAARDLESEGISCTGYGDLDLALAETNPDIVALCSPITYHREQLETVARAGCHCLCEKPFFWTEEGEVADRGAEAGRLVDAFSGRGLVLALLTQWPCTLPFYDRLWPGVATEAITSFSMLLGPTSTSREAILDSAPHPLSMLQRLLGCGVIEDAQARWEDPDGRDLSLGFGYRHRLGRTEVTCRFTTTPTPPRPAGYALNGRWVDRAIELPSYRMVFRAGEREVPIEDPLDALVLDFLRRFEEKRPEERWRFVEGIRNLEALVSVLPRRGKTT
jgi:hypothetical protein